MSYNPNYDPTLSIKPRSSAPWVLAFAALAGAAGGGYWLYQGRQNARQDVMAATQRAEAAEAEKTELSQKVEKLETEKTELASAKEELAKDVQAKAGELEAKTGELAQLKGTFDNLQEKMKDEISKGDIRLSQSGGRLRVDLVDKILFDSGEAVVSKRGEGVLGRVGAVLATVEDKQIQVSGHTDSNPISEKLTTQWPTNWELSVARAVNVVRFLEEKAGVPPKTLLASGYGQHHPIASNKNAHGRARNRRIEILLTPSLAPKAMGKEKLKLAQAEAKDKEPPKLAKADLRDKAEPKDKAKPKEQGRKDKKAKR